jgi:hypothetical protein
MVAPALALAQPPTAAIPSMIPPRSARSLQRCGASCIRRAGRGRSHELVDWFNTVDLTHRADLRELNELYYARFDAKLERAWPSCARSWSRRSPDFAASWYAGCSASGSAPSASRTS